MNGILLLCFGCFLAGLGYCIRKIWNHDGKMLELEAKIAAMQANCSRHQTWQEDQARALGRIDKNLTRIAAKLDVDIDDG
jgi:hypothetical protein